MADTTAIRVDLTGAATPFRRFWRSTGFSPAELLLEPEMQQTLAYVGGVPRHGIEYLRVHYMLDLVTAERFGRYDWTRLDRALDVISEYRLKPFFELMGNPSYLFTDLNARDQVHHWRDFMAELAHRYRQRFGAEELRSWYFETWNEPDIWWTLGGETGFNNYYDACHEGLRAVEPEITLGGPGVARRIPPIFKSFLAHCDTGENVFTGERGVRLDFISVHEKGARKHAEDLTPNSLAICQHEMMAVDYVRQHHPRFAHLPFINNECDPQIGWHIHHTWHALPYFAGLAAKIIDQHQRLIIDNEGVDYPVLSNDNGFLGRWGNRTHLAYFGDKDIKAAQNEHLTDIGALDQRVAEPEPFELIKKPALSVMELLAWLGEERLSVSGDPLDPDRDGLGVIATRLSGGDPAILVYYSVDSFRRSGERPVRLTFDNVAPGVYALALFRIEDGRGDPYSVWETLDDLDKPGVEALAAMRAAQEPALAIEQIHVSAANPQATIKLDIALPGVALAVLARRGDEGPSMPRDLKLTAYAGLNGAVNTVLFWQTGGSDSLELFDVFWSESENGPYRVVNPAPLLSTVYLHSAGGEAGFYKVQARDVFGRVSPPSPAVPGIAAAPSAAR
ncbi:L-iduronidase [Chelatococcus asaccharovorans]|uniref:L-iduronidase n=2 Tax=Chelatococcus asaccharovorans TaxID=28210 RepID=A0A2V3TXD7_9HYPH|nr:L-iduronidase [Chelatococcus asaccharovorans]